MYLSENAMFVTVEIRSGFLEDKCAFFIVAAAGSSTFVAIRKSQRIIEPSLLDVASN